MGPPMDRHLFPRLVMLGPARDARNAVASTVEAYRAQGLFKRWPVDYLALGGGPLAPLKALRSFTATLIRHGRVVLHVHAASRADFRASMPFMAIALAARCPLLLQMHGGDFRSVYESASGPSRALVSFFLERAAGVLAPCEAMRAWLHGVARRADVICLPTPVPAYEPAATERQPIVLFLGPLEPQKGVFDLMDAVAGLRGEVPDVRLVCAGAGRRRPLEKYARHLGMAETVKITGWLGPSGKRALFETASVYVRPSYEDGLPLSLLESMAAGVPVVASAVGGIPEVVVEGVTGYLVAPGDTASLRRLLRKLLKEPLAAARVGKAARESVRLRFAPERVVARLEALYAGTGLTAHVPAPGTPDAGMREAA